MAFLRGTLLVLFLGAAGLGCAAAGQWAAGLYGELLAARLAAAMAAVRLDWAELRVDGLRVDLHGHAPDPYAQALAAETVRLAAPRAVLTDHSSAALPPPVPQPAPRIEIHRDGIAVTLTGALPDAAARAGLARAFAEEAPRLAIEDLTREGSLEPGDALPFALAARAVAAVPQARAVLEPGRLGITGLARDDAERLSLSRRLLAAAPAGFTLELALRVPPPVIAPFAFAATLEARAGLLLESCAARDAAEAVELAAALERAGLRDVEEPCAVGLGGPPGDWPGAVMAGLEALQSIGAGRFSLHYRMGEIAAPADMAEAALEAAGARLAAVLPAGYEMRLARLAPGPDADDSGADGFERRFWLSLSSGEDGVVLAGLMPGRALAEAMETLALARFPGRVLHEAFALRDAPAPEGWREAAFAALEALALLPEGRVQIAAGRLVLEGSILDPEAAAPIHRTLESALPWLEVETRLRVDLPARVAAVPLGGARCALLLNRLMERRPLRFAPGSAVLEADGAEILDAAAELLGRCPEAVLEIGGHTDAQGSEGFNLRLSRARAEAVRDALLARGIALSRIPAKGYGEAVPIADNRTEEGRALNRRIAFSLLSEPVSPEEP